MVRIRYQGPFTNDVYEVTFRNFTIALVFAKVVMKQGAEWAHLDKV